MTIDDDPVESAASELSMALDVHHGMTKTVLRIRPRGSLKFRNKSTDKTLTIKSPDTPPPFDVPGFATPQSQFTVPANDKLTVSVSDEYSRGGQFTYSAQIEGSTAEDPIVIVDRR